MLSETAKIILIKALQIRYERGEDINEILETYKNLSSEEKEIILRITTYSF